MTTLRDVALAAQVSTMTVSRAINNPSQVKPESLAKVRAAIQQLGYQTNRAAKALVTGSTGLIRLIAAEYLQQAEPYFVLLFAGINDVLNARGLSMVVSRQLDPTVQCDGTIVMSLPANQSKENDLQLLSKLSGPVVIFGKGPDHYDWVDVDNAQGTYATTQLLTHLGHQQMAFFGINRREPFVSERIQGFLQALEEAQLSVPPSHITSQVTAMQSVHSAKLHAIEFLCNHSVSAVVCVTDMVALGVIQGARALGLRVPEDLSVTGFDGVYEHTLFDPPLTTAEQPVRAIGRRLAEALLDRLENPLAPLVQELFPTKLVVRESTTINTLIRNL